MNIVYIIHSNKLDRFYIGFTTDFELRLEFHLKSEDTQKFTHKANDWVLFYKIECRSKPQALAIEKHIKRMKSKVYIQNLLRYPELTQKLLDQYSES